MITPGCFSSVAVANAASETCRDCLHKEACFSGVRSSLTGVLAAMNRKLAASGEAVSDAEKELERVGRYVDRAISDPGRAPVRSMSRDAALARKFRDDGVDVALIKARLNPFDPAADPFHFKVSAFIVEGVPFKPKDVIEFLHEQGDPRTTETLRVEVARFTKVLVDAGILERKERNILCLSR